MHVTGTGAGPGAGIGATTTTYDPVSGDVTAVTTTPPEGAPTSVAKEYDVLGRLTAYTDGDGGRTETTHDRYGKPVLEEQFQGEVLIGSREFAYNLTDEPRGFLTSIEDSVGGLITAEWGPDGQLVSESLPGGVELSITYDPASVPVARQYVRVSDGAVIWQDSVVENHRGQWIGHTSSTGVASYAYDDLGRLVAVDDVVATANPTCTRRTYTYDGHSNRTGFTTATGDSAASVESAVCPTEPDETVSSTYDSADRLVSGLVVRCGHILLDVDEDDLLTGQEAGPPVPRDGTLLGAMFEALAGLTIRVCAQAADAGVGHMRRESGDHEVDFVVTGRKRHHLAIEVKLAEVPTARDARHLLWLKERMGDDLTDTVLVTTGRSAYRRADGIAVVPLALLGP